MSSKNPSNKPASGSAADRGEVERFLASLDHPFKREILALRRIILAADPGIAEAIKWNAPSFRTSEYFATFHLRAKDGVQVILHRGARRRDDSAPGVTVEASGSLLAWLAADRASAKFADLAEIEAGRSAFTEIIRAWIKQV